MRQARSRREFMWQLSSFGAAAAASPFRIGATADAQNPPPPPPAPAETGYKATIVGPDEAGDRLVVLGKVFAPDSQHPVVGVFVYAYNTDKNGHYSPDGKVYPPRLKGYMKTDEEGRFELHTIVPGRYPGRHIPAHIHFILWGAGYPVQWVDELQFEGDSYITEEMRRESLSRGKFATIRPLTRDRDGVSVCSINLAVREQSNFSGQ